ncbi:MAG: hypothetical protein ACRCYC_04080 [Paraclostridium sp.]|uniref:hypothetical protein n=1 Tax=Paraclostridium sp. TaxID=2023273 RepID=UPI003F382828
MLRYKEGLIPKYTKREYKAIKEKERIDPIMNDAYHDINDEIYKLLNEYPKRYKYERILFFDELKDGYEIHGVKFPKLKRYLNVLGEHNLPQSETMCVIYEETRYNVPTVEISKLRDICDKLDKLFAETDYKLDELIDQEVNDSSDKNTVYEQRHIDR